MRPSRLANGQGALEGANGDLIAVHTSGHVRYDDIVDFEGQINARIVVPIHTFEPEKFTGFMPNIRLLADGKTMTA